MMNVLLIPLVLVGMLLGPISLHRIASKSKEYAQRIKQKVAEQLESMQKAMEEAENPQTSGTVVNAGHAILPDVFVCEKCGAILPRKDLLKGSMQCPDCGQFWQLSDFHSSE
jgi:rubrerythrin